MQMVPQTQVVQRLLARGMSDAALVDLIFLEMWECYPASDLAQVRRASQIRRAQPAIAAAIRTELADPRHPANCHSNDTPAGGRVR